MATTTAGPNNTYKLVTVLFCLFTDFFVSITLFFHGKEFSRFKAEILAFEYCTTTIDFWVLAIIRFCLLLGSVIGFARNKREAIHRLSKSTRSIFYLSAALIIYVVVKCLIASECHLEKDKKLWFWCFAGFSILGSGSLTFSWYLLSKYKIPSILSTEEEVGDILERESLLDSELDGIDSKNKRKKKKKRKNAEVEEPSASTWKLLSYSKPDFGYLMLAFLFLLLACGAQIFLPYFTGQVIDSIAIEKDKKKFEMAILYMGLISLGDAICAGLRGGIFTFVCARFNIRINNQLFGSIINQDIGFFDKTKTGEIVSRLTSDTTKMSDQVCLNVNVFLRNIVLGLGVCIFMFKLSWQLTVVTLIGLPLIAFISEVYGNYYKKLSTAVQDCVAKTNEVAAEVVSSMKTVRSFANEDGELKRYKRKNHKVFKLKIKEALALGGYNSCTEVMMLAMEVAILYYGGHLVLKGYLSGGNLVSFILYQLELTNCLEEIGDVYTGLMEAVGAAEKVFRLIEKKPSISNDGKIIPHSCEGSVEFKNVSFSYPGRPDALILNDVSFKVQPGQVVALVGASGGGKSTCINLLEHFYEPSSGEVCIDAVPVKDLDHKYLHTVVSLVGQEPVLFGRSVTKNIAYGIEDLTNDMQKIEYAAALANAHSFIREMPEAYQTETGEKGLQLSGGQKQRIAIARALIRNPKILLLDEATSALDAESEHLVQDAIYRNLQGHTVLIIAHRLSTIEKADLVIVIDKGQVAEKGTHAELIAKDGLFNKLVQRQLLGPDKVGSSSSDPDSDGVRQRAKKRRDSNSSVSSSSSGSSSSSEKGFRGGYSVSPPKL